MLGLMPERTAPAALAAVTVWAGSFAAFAGQINEAGPFCSVLDCVNQKPFTYPTKIY